MIPMHFEEAPADDSEVRSAQRVAGELPGQSAPSVFGAPAVYIAQRQMIRIPADHKRTRPLLNRPASRRAGDLPRSDVHKSRLRNARQVTCISQRPPVIQKAFLSAIPADRVTLDATEPQQYRRFRKWSKTPNRPS